MADAWKTPAPDDRPAFRAEPSPAPKTAHESGTITADDWKRSIASARAQANLALQQIRTAVASRFPKAP